MALLIRVCAALCLILASGADARLAYGPAVIVPNNTPFLTPEVRISAGQSWRSNYFTSTTDNGFNPQTQTYLTLAVKSAVYPSGVLSLGSGINLPAGIQNSLVGLTSSMLALYPPPATAADSGNAVDVGRAGIFAQQYLRIAAGVKTLVPILNYNMACPSSDWVSGPCSGLGPGSTPWTNMGTLNTALIAALPSAPAHLNAAVFKSVGWTQGGALDGTLASTVSQWTDMEAQYDALNLPGAGTTGMLYYIGIRAMLSTDTTTSQAVVGAYQFVRANANGRTIGTCPWYQWPFLGTDTIHLGNYGTIRLGECEGMAADITEREGTKFKPLWRALSGNIVVSGQTITVPFDRPVGTAFATSTMQWMSDANDGIKVWPQNGWQVKRSGSFLTVTPTIVGMTVRLAVAETISPGDVLEVSYAFYGPGGPSPGPNSGVGGNLTMPGPASSLYPGKTINSWAWPFAENVTAP